MFSVYKKKKHVRRPNITEKKPLKSANNEQCSIKIMTPGDWQSQVREKLVKGTGKSLNREAVLTPY